MLSFAHERFSDTCDHFEAGTIPEIPYSESAGNDSVSPAGQPAKLKKGDPKMTLILIILLVLLLGGGGGYYGHSRWGYGGGAGVGALAGGKKGAAVGAAVGGAGGTVYDVKTRKKKVYK